MELNNDIIGSKLNEIQKNSEGIKLVFENSKTHKVYVLKFDGLLFETSVSAINRKVKTLQWTDNLGFRAMSTLRQMQRNPNNYKQLFIQMEGSNDNNKLELIGAFEKYKIAKRTLTTSARTASRISKPKTKASKK